MTATSVAFQSQSGLVVRPELSGRIHKVVSEEYRKFTDEALDGEIVASVDAAHGHYDGLRRELVMRLLPALAEMRRRHGAQGARNDLNSKLGLPRQRDRRGIRLRWNGKKVSFTSAFVVVRRAVKCLTFCCRLFMMEPERI